jgi:hypothetical protein
MAAAADIDGNKEEEEVAQSHSLLSEQIGLKSPRQMETDRESGSSLL